MKRATKIIVALICIAAIMSTVVACGRSDAGTPSSSSGSAQTAGGMEKHIELSYACNYGAGLPDSFYSKNRLEEKFNVSIKLIDIDLNSDWASFQLMVTAGDMPDFVSMNRAYVSVLEWYEQDVIRSVSVPLVREYAPDFASTIDLGGTTGWMVLASPDNADDLMALTGYYPETTYNNWWASYYRLDWLDNIGVAPNGNVRQFHPNTPYLYVTDTPFTKDQFLDIMYKFKYNDPNLNGIDDTVPISCTNGLFAHSLEGIASIFGLAREFCLEENGRTINHYSSERYKEFLKFAAELYDLGYMDKDWFNTDWTTNNEKCSNGLYGYYASTCDSGFMYPQGREEKTSLWSRMPLIAIADNPDGKILVCPHETGADGKSYSAVYSPSPYRYQLVFEKHVSDEKMVRLLQLLNYARFDGITAFENSYGVEGVQYNVDDDGFGGKLAIRVPTDKLPSPEDQVTDIFGQMWQAPNAPQIFKNYIIVAREEITGSKTWMDMIYGPHRIDLLNETDYASVLSDVGTALSTTVNEYWAGAIAGNFSVDATWDEYIANLDKAGYQKLLDELNKAPLFSDLMPGFKGLK